MVFENMNQVYYQLLMNINLIWHMIRNKDLQQIQGVSDF